MLKRVLKSGFVGGVGLYGLVYSQSEELQKNHYRVGKACVRAARIAIGGTKMAWIYTVRGDGPNVSQD